MPNHANLYICIITYRSATILLCCQMSHLHSSDHPKRTHPPPQPSLLHHPTQPCWRSQVCCLRWTALVQNPAEQSICDQVTDRQMFKRFGKGCSMIQRVRLTDRSCSMNVTAFFLSKDSLRLANLASLGLRAKNAGYPNLQKKNKKKIAYSPDQSHV